MEEGKRKEDGKINKYSCTSAIVASMTFVIVGYETGVMDGAMISIAKDLEINDVQVEVLPFIISLCTLVSGALCAGRTSDYMGRQYTICSASVIFFLGFLIMGFASTYAMLLAGECVAAIGMGFALVTTPVYVAEISATRSRGILASLPELAHTLGILLGYISSYIFAKLPTNIGWRVMFTIAAIPSLGLAFGILKLPKSPYWLVMQGRLKDAKQVLSKVSNTKEEAESRLQDIKLAIGIDPSCNDDFVTLKHNTRGQGVWKELLLRPTPSVRWMLLAVIGIHFFKHATGIEALNMYGPIIFEKAGVISKDKQLLMNIGEGSTTFLFNFASICLIDKVGRRKLLLTSVGGMIVALLALGFALNIVHQSHDQKVVWALWLSVGICYLYIMFFSMGLAPVTWVYTSEIFPLKLRAQGASIGVAVSRVTRGVVSMTFLSLVYAITIGGAFFMFAGMSVLAWVFFFFFLPETKGRSLEEMEQVFTRRKKSRNVDMHGEAKQKQSCPSATNHGSAGDVPIDSAGDEEVQTIDDDSGDSISDDNSNSSSNNSNLKLSAVKDSMGPGTKIGSIIEQKLECRTLNDMKNIKENEEVKSNLLESKSRVKPSSVGAPEVLLGSSSVSVSREINVEHSVSGMEVPDSFQHRDEADQEGGFSNGNTLINIDVDVHLIEDTRVNVETVGEDLQDNNFVNRDDGLEGKIEEAASDVVVPVEAISIECCNESVSIHLNPTSEEAV